jgi:hypothetical protein
VPSGSLGSSSGKPPEPGASGPLVVPAVPEVDPEDPPPLEDGATDVLPRPESAGKSTNPVLTISVSPCSASLSDDAEHAAAVIKPMSEPEHPRTSTQCQRFAARSCSSGARINVSKNTLNSSN